MLMQIEHHVLDLDIQNKSHKGMPTTLGRIKFALSQILDSILSDDLKLHNYLIRQELSTVISS